MNLKICSERQRLLESASNLLVLGGPGSGKTTIAILKCSKETANLLSGQKTLFLSFARATVARVIESANDIIPKESLEKIEVNTYHGFFWNILRSHSYLINPIYPLSLITPSEAAVRLSHVPSAERHDEFKKMFRNEGVLGFDLFATYTKDLLKRSKKMRSLISGAFPIIFVDEFQDTNKEEWEVIKLLSESSTIIALADADQRIYEFRGADPARIGQLITTLNPLTFDFGIENNRSNGTDIAKFGNDLLTGATRSNLYNNVEIYKYPYYKKLNEMYSLKTKLLSGINRVKGSSNWSIALLVPTKKQMLQASNYLLSSKDNLPSIDHDVSVDSEGPSLAGALFSLMLENYTQFDVLKTQILESLISHMRGRKGSSPPTIADMKLSIALEEYLKTGKIRGSRRLALVKEVDEIVQNRLSIKMTGNPWDDWFSNLKLFFDFANESALENLREDARYVRILHKGSSLRESLSAQWRSYGEYRDASLIFSEHIKQENFSMTTRKHVGIHVMTIHKAKGKQFDEVFLYEGFMRGRFVRNPLDLKAIEQSKLLMRVGVTRAISKATVLTPSGKPCEII
ncbi:MAG: UvrD-helicase domain-containing protein [Bacteriovoracaceae bacterium]|nr:UvrD-helicase domain-containing protein [Bacteriovoracaceae bacterium]